MSYAGLGLSYDIGIPGIGSKSVDIPVEQVAQDLVNNAVPALQARVPEILADVTPQVTAALNKQLPGIINKQVPVVVAKVMPEAQKLVDNALFPVKIASTAAVLAIIATTVLTARWVKLGRIL